MKLSGQRQLFSRTNNAEPFDLHIELNPVRAAMVGDPAHYRWTSYLHNGLGQADSRITAHPIYDALGPGEKSRQSAYRALFSVALESDAIDNIRLALNQNQPLGNSRFYGQIERKLVSGERRGHAVGRGSLRTRIFRHCRGRESCLDCKTNDADPNGTYLSVSMATDGLSMQRVTFESTPSPGNGGRLGWGRCMRRCPHPSLPPQLRGKEPDSLAFTGIAAEKQSIRRLSKCHSTLPPFTSF